MKNDSVERVAYRGVCFSIEWYVDARGYSPAQMYYKELPAAQRLKVLHLFKRMGDVGGYDG